MRKSQFIAAAAALLALTACTDDNLVVTGDELAQLDAAESSAIQFGTYMSGTPTTRAAQTEGALTTTVLQSSTGLGVFAYYTKNQDFQTWIGRADQTFAPALTGKQPNFMFNQQVSYQSDAAYNDYVSRWTYTPLKYWPNDFSSTDVDDQDGDANNNPASGTNTADYGGNLTFFAYAPYQDFASVPSNGVIEINGQTTIAGAKGVATEPILTYLLSNDATKVVDLLWGTMGATSVNVNDETPAGLTGETGNSNSYLATLRNGYTVNANLTKQKTNGTVNFAFKHALAKVGGKMETTTGTTDHGLLIKLDTDNMKGAETGGAYDNDKTKVTLVDIQIEAVSKNADASDKYFKSNVKGKFNLATGQWSLDNTAANLVDNASDVTASAKSKQIITSPKSALTSNAVIADGLAEPSSITDEYKAAGWANIPNGVQLTAQNVYKSETNPLVFIPGTKPELTITVDYIVRTLDDKLKDAYTEVRQKIKKTVAFTNPVELNKQYNLLIHLGLTGVKFTATVDNWEVEGDTNGDGVIGAGETIVPVDVYTPINVSTTLSLSATLTSVAGTATTSASTISAKYTYYDESTGKIVEEASPTGVSYASSDEAVATVTSAGEVSFVAANTGTTSKSVTITGQKDAGAQASIVITQQTKPVTVTYDGTSKFTVSHDAISSDLSDWAVTVLKDGSIATVSTDYTISGTEISIATAGNYTVTVSKDEATGTGTGTKS